MIIRSLKLKNFRNYNSLNITLGSKMNIFIGDNASGKTNILEGISILGLTKSFRDGKENDFIRINQRKAIIEGRVIDNGQLKDLKIELLDKEKNIYINSKRIYRYADYISNLVIVLFTPDDLNIIKGSPNIRRSLLNVSLSQMSFSYLNTYNEYNKILKTRNEYLKVLYNNNLADKNYLDILTNKLVEKALIIYQLRHDYLVKINNLISDIYNEITGDNKIITIDYKPNLEFKSYSSEDIRNGLLELYNNNYNRELQARMTLYGPHRDDFIFLQEGLDMKKFASQGQQKSVALAYKFASIPIFKEVSGTNPVLLLDDIFSELDISKRNKMLNYINKDIQCIITTTDLKNISKKSLNSAVIFNVDSGKVERS